MCIVHDCLTFCISTHDSNRAYTACTPQVSPKLFTIATLTGHVVRAYGVYSGIISVVLLHASIVFLFALPSRWRCANVSASIFTTITAVMDNGPARKAGVHQLLSDAGIVWFLHLLFCASALMLASVVSTCVCFRPHMHGRRSVG